MRPILLLLLLLALPSFAQEELSATASPDEGHHELYLVPGWFQLNGVTESQMGAGAAYVWHAREGFGLTLRFTHRLGSSLTAAGEMAAYDSHEPLEYPDFYSRWALIAGTELAPLSGEGFFLRIPAHVSLVIAAGGGVSRYETMMRGNEVQGPWYFDFGLKPSAEVSVGGRLKIGRFVTLRMEVADNFTFGRADQISGCSVDDLSSMNGSLLRSGQKVTQASVSPYCDRDEFAEEPDRVPLALSILLNRSGPDFLQTVSFRLGAGVVF